MNDEIIEFDMMPKLIGETYMKYPTETSKQRYSFGVYECQYCGKEWEVTSKSINTGNTKSCGCQKYIRSQGLTHNQFYKTWKNMMGRCTNLKHKSYPNYGARGITVCDEWLNITNFITWCEETYPNIKGYSLDRIDNDKGYSPDNCTWSSRTIQNINQRMKVTNTSGFVGVSWNKKNSKWFAQISVNKIVIYIGSFLTKEEAVQARDNYIIQNNLPHKLSTDYKKEN